MARIHRLPDLLVNQIAAGEVVERPASVVKELIENALDAGARSVRVRLAGGGRDLVEVEDDGCGMDEEDAALALERHATSKISQASDLTGIATFGFRGEALPSIAAAAVLTLETAASDGEGTRIRIEHGHVVERRPCARARGTTITVHDLFDRLPARRKFLRSDATELRHATSALAALAFAHPEVAFVLEHGGRTILRLPAARDRAQRLPDLVGANRARAARPIAHGAAAVDVSGFLVPSSGARDVVLVVNGRVVRDRLLIGAVNRALRDRDAAEVYLELRLPAGEVDVNVHPTKAEVRFAEPGRVFAAVTAALATTLLAGDGPVDVRRVVTVSTAPRQPRLPWGPPGATAAAPAATVAETALTYAPDPAPAVVRADGAPRLLGQYRDTYLLVEDDEGLVLIDQHVAHERILYEALIAAGASTAAQRLLIPEVVELPPARALLAAEALTELAALGLELEPASGASVRVLAVPASLPATAASRLVGSVLEDLAAGLAPGEDFRHRAAALLACHAAIKKNQPLPREAAERLLRQLALAHQPHRCPHGRPIALRLPHEEIERRIGRT